MQTDAWRCALGIHQLGSLGKAKGWAEFLGSEGLAIPAKAKQTMPTARDIRPTRSRRRCPSRLSVFGGPGDVRSVRYGTGKKEENKPFLRRHHMCPQAKRAALDSRDRWRLTLPRGTEKGGRAGVGVLSARRSLKRTAGRHFGFSRPQRPPLARRFLSTAIVAAAR